MAARRTKANALTVYFAKAFHDGWLAQASYTLSYLRGNINGLFRPGTGLIEVNHSADYDTKTIEINRNGPLPGDHRHDFKLFGAKDWLLTATSRLSTGLGLHGRSGAPTTYLGSYPDYGPGESFLCRRAPAPGFPGSSERMCRLAIGMLSTRINRSPPPSTSSIS